MLMQCKGPMLTQCKGPMLTQCKGPMLMQCQQEFACCMTCACSKNELARSCKIVQESCKNCMQDLHVICPFSCTILAQSCTYLARNGARFCKSCCKNNYLHFLHIFCKILQELCKKRDILRASLACKILARFLHDLASSFLLGYVRTARACMHACMHAIVWAATETL